MRHLTLALFGLVLAAGCKRSPPPPPSTTAVTAPSEPLPTSAPAAHFDKTKLVLDGHPEWTCNLSYGVDGDVSCSAVGSVRWPGGTKLAYGKEDAAIENYASATLKNTQAIYGGLPIAELDPKDPLAGLNRTDATLRPHGKLVIRFSNGVESTTEFPEGKIFFGVADKVMKYAASHPLTFEGETKHEGAHTIYFFGTGGSTKVLGPGHHLVDADWIAVATRDSVTKVEGVTCKFMGGVTLPLETAVETVKIVDRATNATIETKTFSTSARGCPSIAFGDHAIIGAGEEAMVTWMKSVAKAH